MCSISTTEEHTHTHVEVHPVAIRHGTSKSPINGGLRRRSSNVDGGFFRKPWVITAGESQGRCMELSMRDMDVDLEEWRLIGGLHGKSLQCQYVDTRATK